MSNKFNKFVFIQILLITEAASRRSRNRVVRSQYNSRTTCSGFKCSLSGECIDEDSLCDGKANCRDLSDETFICSQINCPLYLFQCKYGACINADLECDGKQDCRDNSDETHCKRTTMNNCRVRAFQCHSGACIPEEWQCDGRADCDDGSDETVAICGNVRCPGFSFRCAYGACVNANARCNGVKDCHDNSDEDVRMCTNNASTDHPKLGGKCVLPNHPQHGHIEIIFPLFRRDYVVASLVDTGTFLQVKCYEQHKLEGVEGILCNDGNWSSTVGTCSSLCPPLKSTAVREVTCYRNGVKMENCLQAGDGVIARFQCGISDEQLMGTPDLNCQDGSWDFPPPICSSMSPEKIFLIPKDCIK